MSDDLVKRLRPVASTTFNLLMDSADRIEELEAKLAKKDGCLEETYRRWKNGADLRALAKAEGCTQERMRHKMRRYEEDKVRLLEAKLAKAMEIMEREIRRVQKIQRDLPPPHNVGLIYVEEEYELILAEIKGEDRADQSGRSNVAHLVERHDP